MGRYDRSYDFGMRGYPQTTRPLVRRRMRRPAYDRYFDYSYSAMDAEVPLPNRVTRRYNEEYLDDRRNRQRAYGFGGDRMDRMVDEGYYRRPYSTIGGTRTLRGTRSPERFDPGRFGPSYGGRFPDEL